MAKSSKKSKAVELEEMSAAAVTTESSNGGVPVARETSVAKTPAAKSPGRNSKTGARRSGARKTGPGAKRAHAAAQKNAVSQELTPSDDEIRLRAYFISEWRRQNGIVGESADDWLEARRQLQEEARERA